MEMVLKDLRRHHRLLISEGRKITAESSAHPLLCGTVSVIGLGGMFIHTKNTHSCGTVLRLKLVDPFVVFEAECTVRNVAENGLGVEITGITFENEKRLKTLLLHLKPQAS
jgi:hypothetical protein